MKVNIKFLKSFLFCMLACTSMYAETIVVNSTGDQSALDPDVSAMTAVNTITLRSAIERANSAFSDPSNTIEFNIAGAGPHTIAPAFDLDPLFKPTTIDATTQPGWVGNTLTDGRTNAQLKIALTGSDYALGNGLVFLAGGTLKAMVIHQFFFDGVVAEFGPFNLSGCFIGTDVAGSTSVDFRNREAVFLLVADNSLIGGDNPEDVNVLGGGFDFFGGFGQGLQISESFDVAVRHNLIGINAAGTKSLGNTLTGVWTNVGTTGIIEENIISGNTLQGVLMTSGSAPLVTNNKIGTDYTGTKAVGNADGVQFFTGGVPSVIGNLISGNTNDGIKVGNNSIGVYLPINYIIQGNRIGTDRTGQFALPNNASGVNLGLPFGVNLIGGPNMADRNIISGNGEHGIKVIGYSFENVIQNNYIGVNAFGEPLGNGAHGIMIGTSQGPGFDNNIFDNFIAYNGLDGVRVQSKSTGNELFENKINYNLKNGVGIFCSSENEVTENEIKYNEKSGVRIADGSYNNTVQANTICDNFKDGVSIVDSSCNLVGDTSDIECSVSCMLENANTIRDNCRYGVAVEETKCGVAIDNTIVGNKLVCNKKGNIGHVCDSDCSCDSSHSSSSECCKKVCDQDSKCSAKQKRHTKSKHHKKKR